MKSLRYSGEFPFRLDDKSTIPVLNVRNVVNEDNQSLLINSDIEFQILDWRQAQEEDMNGKKNFIVRLFGKTRDNKTIHVQVNKFTPYFYVEIDSSWRQMQIDALVSEIKKKVYPSDNVEGLLHVQTVEKYKFWGFTNYEKFKFLQFTFSNHDSMKSFIRVLKDPVKVRSISNDNIKLKMYESNIEPFLRCMHIRQLDAVGWVSIKADKYQFLEEQSTICDINIVTDWTCLNKIEDNTISPFIIASFDIECTSSDGAFPQANRDGDKIIQIGTTFSRLGEDECFFQHIITLDSCDPISGVVVESYNTEQEVLLAWTRLLNKMNPDVITGYNIFGFDFEYMKDRSKKLGIYERFSRLSRMTGELSSWQEKKLASSALGDNMLKYYDMTGRVLIDLMKVIQRDHRLDSYKLDFVASNFINEEIIKMEVIGDNTFIETKNTYGLKEEQYVTIYYNDGITNNKHMDGKKFQVLELSNNSLLVNGAIDTSIMNCGYQVFWCQAKDDVSPKDIFRLQKGTAKDRAIIAKYCIKDCSLCNKLIAKLQVLTNNIGMANVCHVPLSYLFMRGQGVKIFSLVAKKCREQSHVIPVIVKKYKNPEEQEKEEAEERKWEKFIAKLNGQDDDDDDDDSYEGAIVFDPITGVHYVPIVVLDYNSLYPNSMIHKNLSHECFVINDEKYGNLPGYKYHMISYITGSITEEYDRIKLRSLVDSFKKNNIVEEVQSNEKGIRKYYKIYDKDGMGKKRWLSCEIKTDGLKIFVTNYKTSKFAEKENGQKGIIPTILSELLAARARYKEALKQEPDEFKKSVLDGLQSAYKVTANSLYGQTGASTSPICMKEIAASTTATGRNQLIFSKYFLENIYGKLINLALTDKKKYLEFCKETFAKVDPKKWNNPKEGWTSQSEFEELFYKKMNTLLEGKRLDIQVIYGDSVTADTPVLLRRKVNGKYIIEIKTIETIGNNWKSYKQFKPDVPGLTDKQQDDKIEYEVWSDKRWTNIKRVIRHKTYKQLYRVFTKNSFVDVTEDHSLINENGVYIKPKECEIGQKLLQNDFKNELESYKIENNLQMFVSDNKLDCMDYYLQSIKLGKKVIVEQVNDKFVLRQTNDIINENEIVKIIPLGFSNDYVYDLETTVGRFHAGVGQLIVKNTDSTFFKTNIIDLISGEIGKDKEALTKAIQLGIWASITICLLLENPQKMAYEKVLWPFGLLSKKRYFGNLYEKNPNEFYQKSMGIVLKRRDNAPIVKIVCGGIVDQILNKRSPEGAIEFTKKALKDILSGKYQIDKFIITKTLRGNALTREEALKESLKPKEERSYVDRTRSPHVVLADRMAERDPGNKPLSNDRIPFVYIMLNYEPELQGERVETPDYVLANNLKLDYLFYITNQIQKPATQFLETIAYDPKKIFNQYVMREENRRLGKKPIKSYFDNNTNDNNSDDNSDNVLNIDDPVDINIIEPVKKRKLIVRKQKQLNNADQNDKEDNFFIGFND